MQMKPLVKDILPNFRQTFTNDIHKVDAFSCYGMHLNIPDLQYFQGGFILKGAVDQVPIDNWACLQVSTNFKDTLTKAFVPDIVKVKIN